MLEIKREILNITRNEKRRRLLPVARLKHRLQQELSISVPLLRRLNPLERQFPVRFLGVMLLDTPDNHL